MDKLIQDLFKKKDKDYVSLTNHYLEKINKNVKARGGKMVTGREMNEIYQEGGYYHYLGTEHTTTPDNGINNTRTPIFVIQSRDAPGTFGFGNDLGTAVNQPDIVQNEATGDSPTLSYGINNNNCAGTAGADWELEAAEAELIKAKGEFETASQIAKNDPNKSAVKDAAQTVLSEAQSKYEATRGNSQCAGTSSCTVSYKTSEPPKTIFSKMWGFFSDDNSNNTGSETSNATNIVTKTCAPTQTGGGKSQKKISDEEFNKLLDNAEFKMPKYQKIQFKSFVEHLINQ